MNKHTKLSLVSDINGAVSISNEDTKITIQPDGTVAISSAAPVQLVGACAAKLDKAGLNGDTFKRVTDSLLQRIDLKKN